MYPRPEYVGQRGTGPMGPNPDLGGHINPSGSMGKNGGIPIRAEHPVGQSEEIDDPRIPYGETYQGAYGKYFRPPVNHTHMEGKEGVPSSRSPSVVPHSQPMHTSANQGSSYGRSNTPGGSQKRYFYSLEEHGCGQTWSDVLETSRLYEHGRDDPQTVHLMGNKTVKDNQGRTISVKDGLQKAMDVGMIPIVSPWVISPFKKMDGKKLQNNNFNGQACLNPMTGESTNVDAWMRTIRETVIGFYTDLQGKYITHTQGIVIVCALRASGFKDNRNPLKEFLDLITRPIHIMSDPLLFNYVLGATISFCSNPAAYQKTLLQILTTRQVLSQNWHLYANKMLEYGAALGIGIGVNKMAPSNFAKTLLTNAARGHGLNTIEYHLKSKPDSVFDAEHDIDTLRAWCMQDVADQLRTFKEDGPPEQWLTGEQRKAYYASGGKSEKSDAFPPQKNMGKTFQNKHDNSQGKSQAYKKEPVMPPEKCPICSRHHRGECWEKDKTKAYPPSTDNSGAAAGSKQAGNKPAHNTSQAPTSATGSSNNNGGKSGGRRF